MHTYVHIIKHMQINLRGSILLFRLKMKRRTANDRISVTCYLNNNRMSYFLRN